MAQPVTLHLVGPPAFRARLASALERTGRQLVHTDDAHDAVEALRENATDVVVASSELPHRGADTLAAFSRSIDSPAVVIVIGGEDPPSRARLLFEGADDCLPATVDPVELAALVERRCSVLSAVRRASAELTALRNLATVDPETHLDNERGFQARLAEEFRRALRYDAPLVLLLVDAGAEASAAMTKELSVLVRKATRETDFVARPQAASFAVTLPHTSLAAALTVAERVHSSLRASRPADDSAPKLVPAVGLGGFPARGVTDPAQLVRVAQLALTAAKSHPVRIAIHHAADHEPPLGHS